MNAELSLGAEPIGDAAELILLAESCERENLFVASGGKIYWDC
jgi:hypothetical protein